MKIQAVIVQRNWDGDGKDRVLDCGEFELDSIKAAGPPATVTIKGTGRVSAAPDLIELPLSLYTVDPDYETAVAQSEAQLAALRTALEPLGFSEADLPTVSYQVSTEYENIQDEHGVYRSRFTGYRCSHDLKLSFDLDMDRLSAVLSSLSACSARPQFSIRFTVRDPDAVYDELLRSAAENARAKAEVLCAASGAKLGDLLHIRYGRNESDVYSRTNMMFACDEAAPRAKGMSIRPDDIHLSDTVTFIWAIGS